MLHAIARSGNEYAREAAELYTLVAANFSALLYRAGGRVTKNGEGQATLTGRTESVTRSR